MKLRMVSKWSLGELTSSLGETPSSRAWCPREATRTLLPMAPRSAWSGSLTRTDTVPRATTCRLRHRCRLTSSRCWRICAHPDVSVPLLPEAITKIDLAFFINIFFLLIYTYKHYALPSYVNIKSRKSRCFSLSIWTYYLVMPLLWLRTRWRHLSSNHEWRNS